MKKLGKELQSSKYWSHLTKDYVSKLSSEYHKHRIAVTMALLPKALFNKSKKILDFGCGDAVHFPYFLKHGVNIFGYDICPEIVEFGKDRMKAIGQREDIVSIGGVELLKNIPKNSLDAVLSFNVLAYLTSKEEKEFYKQTARILKPGGYLAVSHSNELFDMFSLNKYTVDFFNTHLVRGGAHKSKIKTLLTKRNEPRKITAYNVRENPLSYKFKLKQYGLKEIRQEFSNLHIAPPTLLSGKKYPDTLHYKDFEKWKLMFTCSTYMSLSIKE